MVTVRDLAGDVKEQLLDRNRLFEKFFARESSRLAAVSREMAERFLKGGRLLAFGRGPYATDAQHISVEFVHPIIVGKRALPSLDLSLVFRPWLGAVLQAEDIVVGFSSPGGDQEIEEALAVANARGAMTLALPGLDASYALDLPIQNSFVYQELIEILYHTLWETVHVFFEHREVGDDIGQAGFLYPFLGEGKQETGDILEEVGASIRIKAQEDARLRAQVAQEESEQIVNVSRAIHQRLTQGGKLIVFGNGGSATDANDLAIDCVFPPMGYRPIPAISLSMEPASLTAIANDVGVELIFLRQLIAHARPRDVAIAISTSGGSRNLIMALEEARKRGLLTVALLGYDGGEILRRGLADFPLIVKSDYIPRIQEVQASIYHVMREALEVLSHGEV
jgi:D-sedoheptulose 7-phosphate isomerase